MWLAVIISVCLAVEVLSYLSGGEVNLSKKEDEVKPEQKSSTVSTSSTRISSFRHTSRTSLNNTKKDQHSWTINTMHSYPTGMLKKTP